jgi:hypothetical protein
MKGDAYLRWLKRYGSQQPFLEILFSIALWCIFFVGFVSITYFSLEINYPLGSALTGIGAIWSMAATIHWSKLLVSMIAFAEGK